MLMYDREFVKAFNSFVLYPSVNSKPVIWLVGSSHIKIIALYLLYILLVPFHCFSFMFVLVIIIRCNLKIRERNTITCFSYV